RLTLRLSEPRGCVGMGSPAVATLDIYDNDTPVDPDANTFGVSGTVSGLLGSGLVLTGFGDHDVTVDSNGPFAFDQKWPSGGSSDGPVSQQPSSPVQACTVTNGTGTLQAADVTNVLVTCAPPQGAHPYLDPSFGVAGRVTAPLGFGGEVVDVLVQSDGKVLVL